MVTPIFIHQDDNSDFKQSRIGANMMADRNRSCDNMIASSTSPVVTSVVVNPDGSPRSDVQLVKSDQRVMSKLANQPVRSQNTKNYDHLLNEDNALPNKIPLSPEDYHATKVTVTNEGKAQSKGNAVVSEEENKESIYTDKDPIMASAKKAYAIVSGYLTTINDGDNVIETLIDSEQDFEPPKRPLSAYNLFFHMERRRIIEGGESEFESRKGNVVFSVDEVSKFAKQQQIEASLPKPKRKHRKTHGKITFTELARTIAWRWKQMTREQRAVFTGYFDIEMSRYKAALEKWNACQEKRNKQIKTTNKNEPPQQEKSLNRYQPTLSMQNGDDKLKNEKTENFASALSDRCTRPGFTGDSTNVNRSNQFPNQKYPNNHMRHVIYNIPDQRVSKTLPSVFGPAAAHSTSRTSSMPIEGKTPNIQMCSQNYQQPPYSYHYHRQFPPRFSRFQDPVNSSIVHSQHPLHSQLEINDRRRNYSGLCQQDKNGDGHPANYAPKMPFPSDLANPLFAAGIEYGRRMATEAVATAATISGTEATSCLLKHRRSNSFFSVHPMSSEISGVLDHQPLTPSQYSSNGEVITCSPDQLREKDYKMQMVSNNSVIEIADRTFEYACSTLLQTDFEDQYLNHHKRSIPIDTKNGCMNARQSRRTPTRHRSAFDFPKYELSSTMYQGSSLNSSVFPGSKQPDHSFPADQFSPPCSAMYRLSRARRYDERVIAPRSRSSSREEEFSSCSNNSMNGITSGNSDIDKGHEHHPSFGSLDEPLMIMNYHSIDEEEGAIKTDHHNIVPGNDLEDDNYFSKTLF